MASVRIYDDSIAPWYEDACLSARYCQLCIDDPPAKPIAIGYRQTKAPATVLSRNDATDTETTCSQISFLSLPLEIRLQIYHWVHLMSPIRHAQLAPWYPVPTHQEYVSERLGVTEPNEEKDKDQLPQSDATGSSSVTTPATLPLLSPYRPLSALPSSILRANSQLYYECRLIPFHTNEFVFVNWFASGLWAARAFTRALKPWQRQALRYARLELLQRDFTGAGLQEWHGLCSDWSGVRGLRLKIATPSGAGLQVDEVVQGLARLESLERVELELKTVGMDDEAKMAWFCEVEEALREKRCGRSVVVVGTQKRMAVVKRVQWLAKAQMPAL